MKKIIETISSKENKAAEKVWNEIKPPYLSSHIKSCATAAKTIINYKLQQRDLGLDDFKQTPRLTKYERDANLRIVFNKNGNATFYTNFSKDLGLKNTKLGEFPEMQMTIAKTRSEELEKGLICMVNPHYVLDKYTAMQQKRVDNLKLGEHSLKTYKCRIKKLYGYFPITRDFSDVTAGNLEEVLDKIIMEHSNNQAIELFAEIRRVWKFAANKYNDCRNPAAAISDHYVKDKVQEPTPCQRYTDIESISELLINLNSAPQLCLHQRNATKYMIYLGVRPINVGQLEWSWIDEPDYPSVISYPKGTVGVRGAMKNQKPFQVPVTPAIRKILLEQRQWMLTNQPHCSSKYVFLQPTNLFKPFSKRSLEKIIKDYSPNDAIRGEVHKDTVKGRNFAFNTMCRKFAKSNIIEQLQRVNVERTEAINLSRLALHHLRKEDDPQGENYNFAEELYGRDFRRKSLMFLLHERSIHNVIRKISPEQRRATGLTVKHLLRQQESEERNKVRCKAKQLFGKAEYSLFIRSSVKNIPESVKDLIMTKEGRDIVNRYLDESIAALAA